MAIVIGVDKGHNNGHQPNNLQLAHYIKVDLPKAGGEFCATVPVGMNQVASQLGGNARSANLIEHCRGYIGNYIAPRQVTEEGTSMKKWITH